MGKHRDLMIHEQLSVGIITFFPSDHKNVLTFTPKLPTATTDARTPQHVDLSQDSLVCLRGCLRDFCFDQRVEYGDADRKQDVRFWMCNKGYLQVAMLNDSQAGC